MEVAKAEDPHHTATRKPEWKVRDKNRTRSLLRQKGETSWMDLLHKLDNGFYLHTAPRCLFNTGDQRLPDFWLYNQQTFLTATEVLSSLLLASSVKRLDSSIKHVFAGWQVITKRTTPPCLKYHFRLSYFLSFLTTAFPPRCISEGEASKQTLWLQQSNWEQQPKHDITKLLLFLN